MKLYFTDTGLCCYLMGLNSPEMVYGTPFSGQLFETFAVMEILKSHWHNGRSPEFFYYRDSGNAEIDLIISENGCLHPVEIKQTGSPGKDDARHFSVLAEAGEKTGYGSVVCLTDKPRAITDNANAISIWNI